MPTIESMHTYAPSDSARRPTTAAFVATVCLRYPAERNAILGLLHQTRGGVFVQYVLAALRAHAAPQEESQCGHREDLT